MDNRICYKFREWVRHNDLIINDKAFKYYISSQLVDKSLKYKIHIIKTLNKEFNFYHNICLIKSENINKHKFEIDNFKMLYKYCIRNYEYSEIPIIILMIMIFKLRLSEIKNLCLKDFNTYLDHNEMYYCYRGKMRFKLIISNKFIDNFVKHIIVAFTDNRDDQIVFKKTTQCYRQRLWTMQQKLFPNTEIATFSKLREFSLINKHIDN